MFVYLLFFFVFFACVPSQHHASVYQGANLFGHVYVPPHGDRSCSSNLTQSQHTDTGSTSPRVDPTLPGSWQGSHCSDNCTCCHTQIEVADQTFYLTHSQYTDSGPTSPSADRLVGLVVKASASRAEFPGLDSRLRGFFSGVVSYQ